MPRQTRATSRSSKRANSHEFAPPKSSLWASLALVVVAVVVFALLAYSHFAGSSGSSASALSMSAIRQDQSATLLSDGHVLLAPNFDVLILCPAQMEGEHENLLGGHYYLLYDDQLTPIW